MILLWFFIALMLAISLALFIWPLLRRYTPMLVESDALNVGVYKERLTTLQDQYKRGELERQEYLQLEKELQKSLLVDVAPQVQKVRPKMRRSIWLASFVIIIVPIASIWLYGHWGYADKLKEEQIVKREAPIIKAELAKLGSREQVIEKLAATVKQHPTNPKGWYLLGKLYISAGEYGKAANALAKANALHPDQLDIMNAYAESLFFAHDRQLTRETEKLLAQILKHDPNNIIAINLKALGAYRREDYSTAIAQWEQILSLVPPDSQDSKTVEQMIAKARAMMTT